MRTRSCLRVIRKAPRLTLRWSNYNYYSTRWTVSRCLKKTRTTFTCNRSLKCVNLIMLMLCHYFHLGLTHPTPIPLNIKTAIKQKSKLMTIIGCAKTIIHNRELQHNRPKLQQQLHNRYQHHNQTTAGSTSMLRRASHPVG